MHLSHCICLILRATAGASTIAYITKDNLVVALASLEGKFAGMLTSMMQGVKKWKRCPSLVPSQVMEEQRVDNDMEVVKIELEEGQMIESTYEAEEVQGCLSHKLRRYLVQSLFEIVQSHFRLALTEPLSVLQPTLPN